MSQSHWQQLNVFRHVDMRPDEVQTEYQNGVKKGNLSDFGAWLLMPGGLVSGVNGEWSENENNM